MPKAIKPDSLEARLKALIRAHGPISVAQFMALALSDAELGYYNRKDPFGARGDFTTAPEISQMFGEMIGAWLAASWQQMGEPKGVALVELGPGRGTLMKDVLRATRHATGFHKAISVHLVEMSPVLARIQQKTLEDEVISMRWHQTIATLPQSPLLVVANEFFDALPIHQMVKTPEGWREKMVALATNENLTFTLSSLPTLATGMIPHGAEGAIVELCPAGVTIMEELAMRIVEYGGMALVMDYGYFEPEGHETLQSVKNHKYHNPLKDIGQADITAHVDFSALRTAAEKTGATVYDHIMQGEFLLAMGIEMRAEMLSRNATEEQKKSIASALSRLTSMEEMGALFKCLCVTPPHYPAPFGF